MRKKERKRKLYQPRLKHVPLGGPLVFCFDLFKQSMKHSLPRKHALAGDGSRRGNDNDDECAKSLNVNLKLKRARPLYTNTRSAGNFNFQISFGFKSPAGPRRRRTTTPSMQGVSTHAPWPLMSTFPRKPSGHAGGARVRSGAFGFDLEPPGEKMAAPAVSGLSRQVDAGGRAPPGVAGPWLPAPRGRPWLRARAAHQGRGAPRAGAAWGGSGLRPADRGRGGRRVLTLTSGGHCAEEQRARAWERGDRGQDTSGRGGQPGGAARFAQWVVVRLEPGIGWKKMRVWVVCPEAAFRLQHK